MTDSIYQTTCWGETVRIRFDEADATSAVRVSWGDDGSGAETWGPDEHGRQAADFGCCADRAMETILREMAAHGGDDDEDEAIDRAVARMVTLQHTHSAFPAEEDDR